MFCKGGLHAGIQKYGNKTLVASYNTGCVVYQYHEAEE